MKKNNHNYAVILAGGQGTRFWPLSRSLEPKQFLSLITARSLFQDTLSRIKVIIPPQNTFIITNQLYFPEIFNYTSEFKIPRSNIIFEPEGKNTAPSIGIAGRLINLVDSKAKMVVLPSDHMIKNQQRFNSILRYALSFLSKTDQSKAGAELKNNLVIFGISPDYPATGYGYIKVGSRVTGCGVRGRGYGLRVTGYGVRVEACRVEKFLEKPDLKTAKKLFKNKRYFWNSGIFAGFANVFLEEINNNIPSLYRLLSEIQKPGDIRNIWGKIEPVSFDYGVLEKTKNLLMVPALNLGWSDLGTWASLDRVLPKDKRANTIRADAIVLGSKNITVFGRNRLVACLGLENQIIVDTPDALLITHKDKSEQVKRIVEILKSGKREEVYLHKTVKRPWGSYTVLDRGLGFKIKLVEVTPKKALSLQKHLRRSEHWIVVEGRAKITKGKKICYVNVNESTFIPVGCIHRLENSSNFPLKIVEVQSGDYLEEDDIIRFKDDFERA